MQSPQPTEKKINANICWLKKQVKRNIFLTTSFSQRLFNNDCLITYFSWHISHNVMFTPMPYHIRPQRHDKYVRVRYFSWCFMLRPPYKYTKISRIRLSSELRNFNFFARPNWNFTVAHLQYILYHSLKFPQNGTTASYQSAADKVWYKYSKKSQIYLRSILS